MQPAESLAAMHLMDDYDLYAVQEEEGLGLGLRYRTPKELWCFRERSDSMQDQLEVRPIASRA